MAAHKTPPRHKNTSHRPGKPVARHPKPGPVKGLAGKRQGLGPPPPMAPTNLFFDSIPGSISGEMIQPYAVQGGNIDAETITADNIAAGTITGQQIAANTISGEHIIAGSINAGDIIATGSITTAMLAAGAVTTPKLAAGAVTADKITAGTITATQIAAGTITGNEIAANTITGAHIQAGSISAGDIIAAGSITTPMLAAGAVTADKISVAQLSAITADMGNLTAGTITGGTFRSGISLPNVVIDPTGIMMKAASGMVTFFAASATGVLTLGTPTGTQITFDPSLLLGQRLYLQGNLVGTGTIVGPSVMTGTANPRLIMDQFGLNAYNAAGTNTFKLDGVTGTVTAVGGTFTGATFQTAAVNPRVILDSTGLHSYAGAGFPATSVLDDFNRADQASGPPSANWVANYRSANGGFRIQGNKLVVSGAQDAQGARSLKWIIPYGPDAECWVTVLDDSSVELWARSNMTDGFVTSYVLFYNASTKDIRFQTYEDGPTGWTTLGAVIACDITPGDGLGFRVSGSTLTAWYRSGGGAWSLMGTRTDTRFTTGDYLALLGYLDTISFDNWGGGATPPGAGAMTFGLEASGALTITGGTITANVVQTSISNPAVRLTGSGLVQTVDVVGTEGVRIGSDGTLKLRFDGKNVATNRIIEAWANGIAGAGSVVYWDVTSAGAMQIGAWGGITVYSVNGNIQLTGANVTVTGNVGGGGGSLAVSYSQSALLQYASGAKTSYYLAQDNLSRMMCSFGVANTYTLLDLNNQTATLQVVTAGAGTYLQIVDTAIAMQTRGGAALYLAPAGGVTYVAIPDNTARFRVGVGAAGGTKPIDFINGSLVLQNVASYFAQGAANASVWYGFQGVAAGNHAWGYMVNYGWCRTNSVGTPIVPASVSTGGGVTQNTNCQTQAWASIQAQGAFWWVRATAAGAFAYQAYGAVA